jgi:hypothetical protein
MLEELQGVVMVLAMRVAISVLENAESSSSPRLGK